MRVLAFDTSTPVTAVAVMDGARVLASDDAPDEGRHGDVLLPRVQSVLERAQLSLSQLQLLAVGIGPGSFTGLRIGLASAKGLAIATGLPLRGVCSLRALAAGVSARAELTVAALDAGKGELFAAVFAHAGGDLQERLSPFRALPADAGAQLAAACAGAASIVVAGTGMRRHPELLAALGTRAQACEPEHDTPHGQSVAQQGLALYRANGASDLASLEPLYLRESL